MRFLLSIGGAGAQQKLFEDIIRHLIPAVKYKKASLAVNVGDHADVWESIKSHIPELTDNFTAHFNDYGAAKSFIEADDLSGIHVFSDKDIFAAVYITNLLIRRCDVLLTKPSELAFYPVPKIMIHRVGGHEAWGAIRAAEVGDGTYECEKTSEVLAMIDALIADGDIFRSLCGSVAKANKAGVYNGAYEAVKLAVK